MADMAVPHDPEMFGDDEGEGSPYTWPTRHALAATWEENYMVRKALRETGKMLGWPNRELTGIGTLAALSRNRVAVADALEVWASHSHEAKSPPVEWLKDEVFVSKLCSTTKC